jgi:hypothetical protein
MNKDLSYTDGRLVLAAEGLTVLRGARTELTVPLVEIREATIEQAKAFKYPRLGVALALAVLVPSCWLLVSAIRGSPSVLVFTRAGGAVVLGILFAAWVVYEVWSSPRICWLRLRTRAGRIRLALPGVARAELEEFVTLLTPLRNDGAFPAAPDRAGNPG